MGALGLGNPKKRIVVSDRATMNEFIANTDAYTVAYNKKAYVETAYYDDRRPLHLSDDLSGHMLYHEQEQTSW